MDREFEPVVGVYAYIYAIANVAEVDYVDLSREYELEARNEKKSRHFPCYFCTFFF